MDGLYRRVLETARPLTPFRFKENATRRSTGNNYIDIEWPRMGNDASSVAGVRVGGKEDKKEKEKTHTQMVVWVV